jgi:hypothetical protein
MTRMTATLCEKIKALERESQAGSELRGLL